jgi:hypothetical protein
VLCPETECRMPWTDEFLDGCFTAVFRNGTLRKHREKLLTDTEKARLPEFQERARRYKLAVAEDERLSSEFLEKMKEYNEDPIIVEVKRLHDLYMLESRKLWTLIHNSPDYIEARNKADKIWKTWHDYKNKNDKHINDLRKRISKKARQENMAPYVRDMVYMHGEPLRWCDPKYREAGDKLYGENSGWQMARGEGDAAPAREVIRISRGCPAEGCRGFLSSSFNCGVCEAKVCEHCHEIIGAKGDSIGQVGAGSVEIRPTSGAVRTHTCNPGAVETAKMLAKETRPCPTCKTLISKIDGCDQMWCTQCQTPFSWRTGQKEEGRVHNPHYYEWLRRTKGSVPREVGDTPGGAGGPECCGEDTQILGLPWLHSRSMDHIAQFIRDVAPEHIEIVKSFIQEAHRKLEDTQAYYRPRTVNPETDGEHLQKLAAINVEYLAGLADEATWTRRIYLEKRNILLQVALNQLKQLFLTAGRDIINSFVRGQGSIGGAVTCRQLGELILYVHGELERITKRFNYTGFAFAPMISIQNVTGAQRLLGIEGEDQKRMHFIPTEMRRFMDIVAPVDGVAAAMPSQGSAVGGHSAVAHTAQGSAEAASLRESHTAQGSAEAASLRESHTAQKPAVKKRAAKPKPSAEPAASCATE